ncbi:MAG: alcohol dehydrogenase [Thermoprotei archaeon]|nr:MAG: alcohol dehydrogenase [Thermoprotei archaeon]
MPRELVLVAPRKPMIREYEERPLRPNEIRIKSILSAEKHGTTMVLYRGLSPFAEKYYDPKLNLFVKRKEKAKLYPMPLGNMTVGIVVEVGSDVKKFKVGDRVYGYLPIRETHTVPEDRVWLAPPELSDEELVCIDPAVVALMAVREGNIRLGERVAIFGLGAIGLMAVQMAKLSGAILVIGIDPLKNRRKLAEEYGADVTFNPYEVEDLALEIRKLTNGKGVDVSLEISGSYKALHEAIRATCYGGRIVPVSWYHGEAKGLFLGEEFHFNRQVIISGARVESEPYREYPLWDRRRVYDTVIELFKRKKLTVKGLLHPIVKFDEVIEAYKLIDEHPEKVVKLGVRYD